MLMILMGAWGWIAWYRFVSASVPTEFSSQEKVTKGHMRLAEMPPSHCGVPLGTVTLLSKPTIIYQG